MNSADFINKLKNIADNYKTVYANGMFGQMITADIIEQKRKQLPKWYTAGRSDYLNTLIGEYYFGFDCVCLIKAVLWGWCGKSSDVNGGAVYASNNIPDIGTSEMIDTCLNVSTDFSNIISGELVYMPGHVGVYIGDGKVIECTPSWENCVQYSNLGNIDGFKKGRYRVWSKHGKLPWITYVDDIKTDEKQLPQVTIIMPQLKKGCRGTAVKTMQQLLSLYGYHCGSTGVDGDFGDKTEKSLKGYQQFVGLAPDGICGNKTWHMLLKGVRI